MKVVLFVCVLLGGLFAYYGNDYPLAVVRHRWQEVITESNHAALRPGSVYDILTHFEQNSGYTRPRFNYFFFDTGLGAADPIYPVFQKGWQESWPQLIKAGLSEQNRHIDHFSVGDTPEGCRIESVYWVRHIDEFPDMYKDLRAQGYTLVDISFDYYSKLRPNAQCGKHKANDADPNFDPMKAIYPYAPTFKTFSDIPPALLAKYEAKVGVLKLVTQNFEKSTDHWAGYAQSYSLRDNSMWFYPDGFKPDYGINTPRTQSGLTALTKPADLIYAGTPALQDRFALNHTLPTQDFGKLMNALEGKPVPGYDASKEPGGDTLDIKAQVTPKNFYTSGTTIEPIRDVVSDVSDMAHYKLVSIILRPAEPEADVHFSDSSQDGPQHSPHVQDVPQVRMVYQLMSPRVPGRAYEQLFLHLDFDAVDRMAPPEQRQQAAAAFLRAADRVAALRQAKSPDADKAAADLVAATVAARPLQTLSWSSSLTGIWVFGILSRSYNDARVLQAAPIVRDGVDLGYYSSAYDNVVFRQAIADGHGDEQAGLLAKVLDDLTPRSYRDPRRHDPLTLTFNRVSCAQCHQMAGRDGVHVSFNDHLDRRVTEESRATEYVYRELDRQLRGLPWEGDAAAATPGAAEHASLTEPSH